MTLTAPPLGAPGRIGAPHSLQGLVRLLHEAAHTAGQSSACAYVPASGVDLGLDDLCPDMDPDEAQSVRAAVLQSGLDLTAFGQPTEIPILTERGSRHVLVLPLSDRATRLGSLVLSCRATGASRRRLEQLQQWAEPALSCAARQEQTEAQLIRFRSEALQASEGQRDLEHARARLRRLLSHSNLPGVVNQLARELGGPVVVQNDNLVVVEASQGEGLTASLSSGDRRLIGQLVPGGPGVEELAQGLGEPVRVSSALAGPEGLLGFLTAIPHEDVRFQAPGILQDAGTLIAYALMVQASSESSQEALRSAILTELLEGRSSHGLSTQSAQVGLELSTPHTCLVFGSAKGQQVDPRRLAQGVTDSVRSLSAARSTALVGVHGDKVYAFVPTPVLGGPLALARRIVQDFQGGGTVVAGVAGDCLTPAAFAASGRDGAWVVDVLRERGQAGTVMHADDLGVFGLLLDHGRADVLEKFVNRWLGPVQEYDGKHRSDLVRTLREYFSHPSLVGTADALHVHVSTLKYRLKRIEAILGFELSDHDAGFNLSLAIRLLEGLERLDRT